ncbi:hypothetical protein OCA16_26000 [Bacillus cereus]|nr:hypothetical protein [Bacillus cereus]
MTTITLTVVTNSITFRVLANEEELISVTEAFRKTKRDKLGGVLNLYCEDLQQNVLVGTEDVKYMSWEPRED